GAKEAELAIGKSYHTGPKHVIDPQAPGPHTDSSQGGAIMYRSPSALSEEARQQIADTLNARLADGLDLHSQIKVAHWNVKGPQFPALHPLFETFATDLAGFNDALAERAVT